LFLLAFFTETAEFQLMMGNFIAGLTGYHIVELMVDRLVQIINPPALFTPEMIMGIQFAIVSAGGPACGAAEIHFRDFSRVPQDIEIAVNSTLADIGYHFPDLVVYPVGGGVRTGTPQNVQDCLSLPCFPSLHINNSSY
jgi:hypothetical protein